MSKCSSLNYTCHDRISINCTKILGSAAEGRRSSSCHDASLRLLIGLDAQLLIPVPLLYRYLLSLLPLTAFRFFLNCDTLDHSIMSSGEPIRSWQNNNGNGMVRMRSWSQNDSRSSPPNEIIEKPPSTPPKKTWERHHKSFLSRRKTKDGPPPPPPPTLKSKDESIRGGSIFGSMFRSSKSTNDLDGTRRRGSEKALRYSNNDLDETRHSGTLSPRTTSRKTVVSSSKDGLKAFPRLEPRRSSPSHSSERSHTPPTALTRQDYSVKSSLMGTPPTAMSSPVPSLNNNDDGEEANPLLATPPTLRKILSPEIALKPQAIKRSDMKKAFTEFHNSAKTNQDSAAAFLGEDSSLRGGAYLQAVEQASSSSFPKTRSIGSLDTVHEANEITLRAIHGVNSWQAGRRYLIAPAALAMASCSLVLEAKGSNKTTAKEACHGLFETTVLGQCLLSFVGGSAPATTQRWSSATLVLRQNYLLEYSNQKCEGKPKGYAHLQLSTCRKHPDFENALELRYFCSPCSQSEPRTLYVRVHNTEERDDWVTCLNRAARLSIDDLYEYDEDHPLGTGQYATVYPGKRRHSSDNNSSYNSALKIFDKATFWKLVVKGRERADTLVRETAVQTYLTVNAESDETFIQLQGFFETSEHVVLELDLMQGTDLFDHISARGGGLAEDQAALVVRDILKCLRSMNRLGMAHRDVKPANILIDSTCDATLKVAVGDFGLATFTGLDGKVRGRCGTPGYVAPEIFNAGMNGGYGNKVDIFSAGVTLYVMLCGYEPFYGETDAELIQANKKAEVDFEDDEWTNVSQEAKDLVRCMMEVNPVKRISVSDALNHPWLARHCR